MTKQQYRNSIINWLKMVAEDYDKIVANNNSEYFKGRRDAIKAIKYAIEKETEQDK